MDFEKSKGQEDENWDLELPSEFKIEEEKPDPDKVEKEDVKAGFEFLLKIYQMEREMGKEVTQEIVDENVDHAKRVMEHADWIAQGEKLDPEKLKLAAALHDISKLCHDLPGGIDTFGHHRTGAAAARRFLSGDLKKPDALVVSIEKMILRHSFIPFIIHGNQEMREKPWLLKPQTKEDYALRDADVLDMADIWGFKKIVEIRQNPKSPLYKEDGGSLQKALESAIQSSIEAKRILVTPTAQKAGEALRKRTEELVTELKEARVRNLNDFRKVFDQFVEKLWNERGRED